jgi:transitional endoplasmic reticulum ATPase
MEHVDTEATGFFDSVGLLSVSDIPEAGTVTGGVGTHLPGIEGVGGDKTNDAWFEHSSAKRVNTDVVIAQSLRAQYPGLQLTIATNNNGLDLLRYAQAGHATYRPIVENQASTANSSGNGNGDSQESTGEATAGNGVFSPVSWTIYFPPRRRIDGDPGNLAEQLNFGKFEYSWQGHDFLLYMVDGRDGTYPYGVTRNQYLLSTERKHANALLLAAGSWANELHGEVWVFDQGYWQKSAELFRSILSAEWDHVILDADMKKAIIEDHLSFFESRETYARLKVPWKRGIIYYGPPGNGKTISIKATMHMLNERKNPIPTLYVRSLVSVSTSPTRFSTTRLLHA